MTRGIRPVPIASCAFLLAVAACSSAVLTGPPSLRLGHDECAECGMIVSDEKFSCALLLEEDTQRSYAVYDDIGCLLDDERDGLDKRSVIERYVHDADSHQWVRAEEAFYLVSDSQSMQTPMGSGIAAFAERSKADAAKVRYDGRVLPWNELAPARRDWMEKRHGKSAKQGD